jgi:hypothetical protein
LLCIFQFLAQVGWAHTSWLALTKLERGLYRTHLAALLLVDWTYAFIGYGFLQHTSPNHALVPGVAIQN